MTITTTAQGIGDGTKVILVDVVDDLTQEWKFIQYGFGVTEPTVWFKFYPSINNPLNVGTALGKLWLKTAVGTLQANVMIGV